ncbi:MAG: MFS transporter [Alphaproteobacteria bacterium]|jgi:MFS family permease|nr:MFS transporter [Alphaproteobacteria bacterium]MDP6814492.1 MFS transporter [Alphaproteobacteria bacterium]
MARSVFFGWWVVAASFTIVLLGFGVAYSFASFFDALEGEFQASRADISLIFSIAGFLYFSLGAVSGPISDRFGSRRTVAFGILLIAAGLFAASLAGDIWQVYLSYGIAVGVGIGFIYVPSIGVVQRWFVRQRGLASGLASAGIGVGTLLAPPFCKFLVDMVGWRGAFQILAGSILLLGWLAAWTLHTSPAARSLHPDGDAAPAGAETAVGGHNLRFVLRTRLFWLLFTASTLLSFGLFVPFVHLAKYTVDHGHPETFAILMVSLIGLGSMSGRFLLGGLADRFGRHRSMIAMYAGVALSHVWWLMSDDLWALALYAVAFGLFYGGYVALAPALSADFFGGRYVSSIIGVLYSGTALGNLIGPVAAGMAYDLTQGYSLPIAAAAALTFLALGVMSLTPTPEKWRERQWRT